jgi:hypothetical protein
MHNRAIELQSGSSSCTGSSVTLPTAERRHSPEPIGHWAPEQSDHLLWCTD